ncbi:MAG: DsbA family oxidoreductase [Gammaproteobacteria bacterium]|nr:DsbA family oxidoreductase [Gammaproteobacteria bacterium]
MSALKIEIVSDPVCPWCYIGKRRLDAALSQRPDLPVSISWSPFQLSPDMPPEGRDRAEHYASIFGEDRAAMIMESMRDTARGEGLEFELKPGARSPNTLLAHVLVAWAEQQDAASVSALTEALFAAHHVDCEDIGDVSVLRRIAMEIGYDADGAESALQSAELAAGVQTRIRENAARGVTGVPFFIFNDRFAVSGAQPADALLSVIDKLID